MTRVKDLPGDDDEGRGGRTRKFFNCLYESDARLRNFVGGVLCVDWTMGGDEESDKEQVKRGKPFADASD